MFADLKGPRWNMRTFRHKIISPEVYKKWKDKTGYNLSLGEFKKVWKMIALQIHEGVIEEPNGVMLPYGLGTLYVGWVKTKNRPVDYKTSKEHNVYVYHENYHSYGKIGKIIYSPCGKYSLKLCKWWGFTGITPFKEKVTKAINTNPEIYRNSKQKIKKDYGDSNSRKDSVGTDESGKTD